MGARHYRSFHRELLVNRRSKRIRRGVKPRLFSYLDLVILIVVVVVGDWWNDCSHEVIDDFNGLSVMSVYLRFLVDDYLVNERTQNFGREFFKVAVFVD